MKSAGLGESTPRARHRIGGLYKKRFIVILCCYLLLLSGCSTKYQRISFDCDTLGEDLAGHISADTMVVNAASDAFSTQLPIYKITERNISQQGYEQMLKALDISGNPKDLELDGNSLFYNLARFTDTSRGYFDMTEEEVEQLAWEYFNKIPFIEGEYECLGIKEEMKLIDSKGEHITRAGVSFHRLLGGVRVVGEDDCVLYFDGSGLVAISISLFDYTKTGTMDMVTLEDAAAKIKTPDAFSIDTPDTGIANIANNLQVDRIKLLLVNQYSDGCTILQPVYNFIGTATFADGSQAKFSSKIIAIPESYTYESE